MRRTVQWILTQLWTIALIAIVAGLAIAAAQFGLADYLKDVLDDN